MGKWAITNVIVGSCMGSLLLVRSHLVVEREKTDVGQLQDAGNKRVSKE